MIGRSLPGLGIITVQVQYIPDRFKSPVGDIPLIRKECPVKPGVTPGGFHPDVGGLPHWDKIQVITSI